MVKKVIVHDLKHEVLENLVSDLTLNENQLLVAMVEFGKYDLTTLPNITKDSKVKGIRFSFRKSDYKIAINRLKF